MRTTAVALVVAVLGWFVLSRAQMHGSQAAPAPSRIDVPPAGVDVLMQDFGGRPVVDVQINDRGPYRFILDTGATITVVGEEISKDLSLPRAGVGAAPTGHGPLSSIVTIDNLRVREAAIGGFMAAVMPLSSVFKDRGAPVGVLSASSFVGCLLTFDYPARRISIKPGSLGAADLRTIFQYKESDTLPMLPVRVAGHATRIHLDTGSAFTLTLPRKFLAELPLKSQPQDSGAARLLGGTVPVSVAAVDGAIEIGQYELDIPQVRFADMRPGIEIGPGNVGYPVLRDFVVTLDSKNRRIQLWKEQH
jgi:hypothetical protein